MYSRNSEELTLMISLTAHQSLASQGGSGFDSAQPLLFSLEVSQIMIASNYHKLQPMILFTIIYHHYI